MDLPIITSIGTSAFEMDARDLAANPNFTRPFSKGITWKNTVLHIQMSKEQPTLGNKRYINVIFKADPKPFTRDVMTVADWVAAGSPSGFVPIAAINGTPMTDIDLLYTTIRDLIYT